MMNNLRQGRNFALSFTSFVLSVAAVVGLISTLAAYANRSASGASALRAGASKSSKKTMRSFGSDEELKHYLHQLVEEQRRAQRGAAKSEPAAPAPAPT